MEEKNKERNYGNGAHFYSIIYIVFAFRKSHSNNSAIISLGETINNVVDNENYLSWYFRLISMTRTF